MAFGALGTLGLSLPAAAVLGGDVASIQADGLRHGGARRQSAGVGYTVHESKRLDGSVIRQYTDAQGRVVMVSWATPYKPRMAELLGAFHADYRLAARRALERPGLQRRAQLQQGDLVVQATVHLNTHVGRAWLRSQLPSDLVVEAAR